MHKINEAAWACRRARCAPAGLFPHERDPADRCLPQDFIPRESHLPPPLPPWPARLRTRTATRATSNLPVFLEHVGVQRRGKGIPPAMAALMRACPQLLGFELRHGIIEQKLLASSTTWHCGQTSMCARSTDE